MRYQITGADPACAEGRDLDLSPNSCGLHVHENPTCDGDAGGHLTSSEYKPDWKKSFYTSARPDGVAVAPGGELTAEEMEGKAFVVHDKAGDRIACAIVPKATHGLVALY